MRFVLPYPAISTPARGNLSFRTISLDLLESTEPWRVRFVEMGLADAPTDSVADLDHPPSKSLGASAMCLGLERNNGSG